MRELCEQPAIVRSRAHLPGPPSRVSFTADVHLGVLRYGLHTYIHIYSHTYVYIYIYIYNIIHTLYIYIHTHIYVQYIYMHGRAAEVFCSIVLVARTVRALTRSL